MTARFSRRPLVLSLLALHGLPALAEEATPTTPETVAPPQVMQEVMVTAGAVTEQKSYTPGVSTVGGKAPAALRDIPQSVMVVDRAVMDDQAVASLTEALRNVPGITISAGEGGNIGDNINLRGYSARTDVYVDGFRDRGQYSRDTFALDAVEVLKGPASMLFGRGSTGGVINQVSKKPDLETRGQIGVSVGTDDYYRTTFDYNTRISDTSAFRIAAFGQDTQSTRDVVEKKDFGLAPSISFGIGTPTEVLMSALVQRNRDIPDYGFPLYRGALTTPENPGKPIAANHDNFYGFTDDSYDQDINVLNASVSHRFNDAVRVQNRLQYGEYETYASPTTVTLPTSVTASTPLDTVTGTRARRERELRDSTLYNQTDLFVKFDTGAIAHHLMAGVEVGRDTYENQAYLWTGVPTTNMADPVYGPMPGSATRTTSATRTDNTAETVAVYVNDQADLTEQLKLVAGVRMDRYDLEADTITNATGATQRYSRVDEMTSVRGGLVWQPDAVQSYYASYGTSFNPSGETLTMSQSTSTVAPEESESFEIGAKYALYNDALQLATAVFRVDKSNARTKDPLTGFTTLDGNTRVDGFEASVAGKLAEKWQMLAGYTYLDSEIVASKDRRNVGSSSSPVYDLYAEGNHMANVPTHSATLWTTYGISANWEIGGGAVYMADRFVDNYEAAVIDDYTRYDATLAYLQKKYDVRLNLQNLGNEEYFETASTGRATPAKGRGAIMTLTYRF
ncbi:MAG TPA: TonB-dependent siderophore receptor [Moraxellaceae bacterium]|nr:TonB-dependent siderophore receptor [Moraxellaceae bacterium]